MRVLLFSLLVILLSACGNGESIIFITTAQPEMAAYLEYYNGSQDQFKAVLNYSKDPAMDSQTHGIIIDSHLSKLEDVKNFKTFNSLFKGEENPEGLDALMFYSELLFKGYYDNNQYFIPLSFTIPSIISKKGETEIPALSYQDILSPEFAEKKNNKFYKIGFDIFWEPHFTYDLFKSTGAKFSQGSEGTPRLQSDDPSAYYAIIDDFIAKRPYSAEEEQSFRDRYFAYPAPKLILQDSIKYYPYSLNDFVKLPENIQDQLQLSFFANNNKITVHEDILYLGIKGDGGLTNGEKHFLNWLLNPETQKMIIDSHGSKSVNNFGFLGGFSSIKTINSNTILKNHSFLPEKLFENLLLSFPEIMAPSWPEMRDAVMPGLLKEDSTSSDEMILRLLSYQK